MSGRWDAVVVGGGPAGLAAAFWLARYRRRTLVLDDDQPRNQAAWAVHGFPGLDDPRPQELRRRLTEQATTAGARIERRRAVRIDGEKDGFRVEDGAGGVAEARRVVLAYGRTDRVPEIPGLRDLYGTSVYHCPDCDGPSVVNCRVGVLGHDRPAARLALYLLTWAKRTFLLTNGREPDLEPAALDVLERHDVDIRTERVVRLEGHDGALRRVRLDDGTLALESLFFHWGSEPSAQLASATGCECEPTGDIRVDASSLETTVPGIYAAGDIVGRPYLASSAAADGIRAALALHRSLLPPEFEL